MNVIDNGEYIIGYTDDVRHYLEQKVKEFIGKDDDFVYTIKDMVDTIVELYELDAEIVKINECCMGGYTIKVLED